MAAWDVLWAGVQSTLEYQNWGWNAITVSFIGSMTLTCIQAWGSIQQSRTLWRERAAKAASVVWLTFVGVLQVAILTYGLSIHSVALTFNGLLALLWIPILIGLWKFKGYTVLDMLWTILFVAAVLVMIFSPYKPFFFFAFGFGGVLMAAMQPWEMWRKHSAQGVEVKLIATFLLGNIFWTIYGLAIRDWAVTSINVIALAIFGLTVLLWWRYQEKDVWLDSRL